MRCGRCAIGFDHHCKWVNNCIGEKNYKEFFALIVVVQIIHVFMMIDTAFVGSRMIQETTSIVYEYKKAGEVFYYIDSSLIMISLLICTLASAFNAKLVAFHIYINIKGITTYQHIIGSMKNVQPEKCGESLSENRFIHNFSLNMSKSTKDMNDSASGINLNATVLQKDQHHN